MRQVVEFYGYKVERNGFFACPFHDDRSPSASIKGNFFNCFVCGAAGDVITFTAKLFGLKNLEAAKKLINDFHLPLYGDKPLSLRAKREIRKAEREKREREELKKLIDHTEDVLADYHRILWQRNDYRYLTQAEYYIACYDSDPEGFSKLSRKWVNELERRIHRFNNERQ